MRHMSFALTTQQIRDRSKTVTRRLGWRRLQPATLVQPVVKGMGLKKGEKAVRVGGPVRSVSVRREPLRRMLDDEAYGREECVKEGFPDMTPAEFVAMFCASHRLPALYEGHTMVTRARPCTPDDEVTRIEFEYVEAGSGHGSSSA